MLNPEAPHYFYAHHVGGRGATVSFPAIPHFSESIYNVTYDADESCVAEIERRWKIRSKVLPYCLADKKRQSSFYLNFCPFTSSTFPFNDAFGNYYEEKRLNYSDYVFKKSFEPQREVVLTTETIDGLFEEQKIPQVDFLSIDTQGAELLILEGGTEMLANTTVAVFCEVSFVDLYRGAPLFGDLDSFMRKKGFLLAGLAPMTFGYKRIPRKFRGLGMPLQGEALYLIKPENIKNEAPADRQLRLEKLAFCVLAFGYTELAFEAVELSFSLNVLETNKIQDFLKRFHREIQQSPALPPLWHDSLELIGTTSRDSRGAAGSNFFLVRLLNRFRADPRLFAADVRRVLTKHLVRTLIFMNLPKLGFNEFERFLSDFGFDRAAKEVCIRRIG